MAFLRRVTANGRRPAWALKLDVASFFPSIHKETLYAILHSAIAHPELLWLTRTVLLITTVPLREFTITRATASAGSTSTCRSGAIVTMSRLRRAAESADRLEVMWSPAASAADASASTTAVSSDSAGTSAAAQFLATNAGTIAVGKEADLLLLNANPFEDIENSKRIHGVMLRGQWLSRRALDELLARHASR